MSFSCAPARNYAANLPAEDPHAGQRRQASPLSVIAASRRSRNREVAAWYNRVVCQERGETMAHDDQSFLDALAEAVQKLINASRDRPRARSSEV